MILKNRRTRETLEIEYSEFRKSLQKKYKSPLKVFAKQN